MGVKRNQSNCKEHEQFVDEAVAASVQCGSAATVEEGDLECISPLGVVKGARKLRLILDLRQVNVCLKKYRFKLEDIRTAAKLFRVGDFVITFDLKSGYHHVDMAEDHWRYLGFSCVVWPPCLAILCYMSGDVGHVCACVKGSVSLGEGVVG